MNGKKKKLAALLSVLVAMAIIIGSVTIANAAAPYAKATRMGYSGSELQMLSSLAAETGDMLSLGEVGTSSYEEAVACGFKGTEVQWTEIFVGKADKSDYRSIYDLACENGYDEDLSAWLEKISSNKLEKTAKKNNADGTKSQYALAVEYGYSGTPEEWIASLIGKDNSPANVDTDCIDEGVIGDTYDEVNEKIGNTYAYANSVLGGFFGSLQNWFKCVLGIKDGAEGKSAYEIAVENGYNGTEVEWLRSLAGKDGKSAYEIACDNGYSGTEMEWLASLAGEKGDNGKSAYELAVENGYDGTETEWLSTLIGPTGATGNNGKTAYEVAVENGFEGTVEEWLDDPEKLKSIKVAYGYIGILWVEEKTELDPTDLQNVKISALRGSSSRNSALHQCRVALGGL